VFERAGAGAQIGVLATYEDYMLVRGATGRTGWVRTAARTADGG
jgi:hypothetical protein